MDFEFSVISGETVSNIVNQKYHDIYEAIKEAYILHNNGKTINPNSYFLRFPNKPNSRIIALPAYVGEKYDVSGIKWISSYPDNIKKNFPRASAVLILNDSKTGYPFACMEASIISGIRTALSAVLAAEYINKKIKEVENIGFIGNGVIAQYILNSFFETGWSFGSICLFDKDKNQSEKLSQTIVNNGYCYTSSFSIFSSAEELIKKCNMIVFTTTTLSPYIFEPTLLAHHPILLNISLRDLSEEIILSSNNIVDDIDHVLNANTSVHLAFQKSKNRNFINGTIVDLISGKIDISSNQPTIFSPMGMGILDLVVGKIIYQHAVKNKFDKKIDNFFIC